MAYNNYFPAGYQPAQIYYPQNNYVPQQNNQVQQVPQPQNNNLIWVQGEAGAKSYLVAPNSSVVLWDTESQTVYIKSADASGMPSIKTLDYTMRESTAPSKEILPESDFVRRDEIDSIRKELDALRAKFEDGKESKK